jgi:hypothetical protein
MSHSKRGFVQGKIGVRSGLGAIPIPISSLPMSSDGCPAGFANVFGTCQLIATPAPGFYTTPFTVLAGRRR